MSNKIDELNPNLPKEQEEINANRVVRIATEPVYHIIIDNCFGAKAAAEILDHLVSLEDKFIDATLDASNTAAVFKSYRSNKSVFLDELYPRWSANPSSWQDEKDTWPLRKHERSIKSPLLRRIDNLFEGNDYMLTEILDGAPFPFCKLRRFDVWETQASRYGSPSANAKSDETDFYTWHHDRISLTDDPKPSDDRMLSMAYYVHTLPQKFEGGNLHLSNGLIFGGELVTSGDEQKIQSVHPSHDRMVIFDSRASHRVMPTKMLPASEFRDGRFSVNCWMGRRELNGDIF